MKSVTTYIKRGETLPDSILTEIKEFVKSSKEDNFEVVINEVKDIRSAAQNKMFHGVILDSFINSSIGTVFEHWTKRKWKIELKKKFLTIEENGYDLTLDTHELDSEQFSNFINNCILYLTAPYDENNLGEITGLGGIILEQHRKIYENSLAKK